MNDVSLFDALARTADNAPKYSKALSEADLQNGLYKLFQQIELASD